MRRAETAPAPAQANGRQTTRAAAVTSVAACAPEAVVANEEVAARLGVSEEWIVARTGVRERRIAGPEERLTDLAAEAGHRALDRAVIDPADLDLVIVATIAGDELLPNASPLVADRLGAHHAAAFDVGAACTGFLSGLAIAAAQVESGRAERVLVIGADLLSRLTDTGDRATAALFADGAGAALVAPAAGAGSIGPIALHADGSPQAAAAIRASQTERVVRMQGHDTFREAVRRLAEATLEAAESAQIGLDEVDLFVYHQANARILAAVGERLGLDGARVVDCIDRYGNTSSATIPIALAEAEAAGALWPGARVLLAAFAAGFTWGAGVLRWG